VWGLAQQKAFEDLKNTFTTAPILCQLDYNRETVVETDASHYVLAGIVFRYDDESTINPVAFYPKKKPCRTQLQNL